MRVHNHAFPNAALIFIAHGTLHVFHALLAPTKTQNYTKDSRSEASNSSRKPAPEFGDGWEMSEKERKGGKTAGTKDKYWWSPGGKRFRSKAQIGRFKEALSNNGGDEEAAWREMKAAEKATFTASTTILAGDSFSTTPRSLSDGDSVATTGTSTSAFAGSSSEISRTGGTSISEGSIAVTPSPNRASAGRSDAQDCASDSANEKKRRWCFI